MHILVCIKQVPDSAQIRINPVTQTIMRRGVPTIINPYDLFSLEEALRLREKHGGKSPCSPWGLRWHQDRCARRSPSARTAPSS